MKTTLRALGILCCLLFLLGATLLYLLIDSTPALTRSQAIAPQAIAEARALWLENKPQHFVEGEERHITLPETLLDEGINYLAVRYLQSVGKLQLQSGHAEILLTHVLNPRFFLNIRLDLGEGNALPQITRLTIGQVDVPQALISPLLQEAIQRSAYHREADILSGAIQSVRFSGTEKAVKIDYQWASSLLERARGMALGPDEVARIRQANQRLVDLLKSKAGNRPPRLAELLLPLLTPVSAAPLQERRASLLVLAAYLAGKNLETLIPDARNWPQPRLSQPTLQGRYDSAQHFTISAALTLWAGEPVAEAIGVYKEMLDAQEGSGFSFADLAADRAGSRFGELVKSNPARIEHLSVPLPPDNVLCPPLNKLPENLSEQAFKQRFGNSDSAEYQALLAEIETRLDTLPLYR